MLETVLTAVGFGSAIHAAGLTNWGGFAWASLLGVGLPDLLLFKTAPQAVASAAGLLVLACVWLHGVPCRRALPAVQALSSLALAGMLAGVSLCSGHLPGWGGPAVSLVVAVCMGVAMGILLGAWFVSVLRCPMGAGPLGVAGLLVDGVLNVCDAAFSDEGRVWMLVAVLAVVMPACSAGVCARRRGEGSVEGACQAVGLRAVLAGGTSARAQLVCAFALVFGFSFVRTTALSEIADIASLNRVGNALIVVAALVALVWSLGMKARGHGGDDGLRGSSTGTAVPYHVVVPAVATLAVLMPVLSGPALFGAAAALHAVFFVILAFLPLAAARGFSAGEGLDAALATETFALLLAGVTFASVGVSTLLSWAIYRNAAVDVTTLLLCALAITYAMVMAYAFLQRETRFARRHEALIEEERLGCEAVASEPVASAPSRREVVEGLAQTYSLTARESDVLLLLARGYSLRGIAGHLDVSDNTVRTHLRNLYRKLQIHSRQEAIELVEGRRDVR